MLPIYLCLGKKHKQVCFFAYTAHWLKIRFIFFLFSNVGSERSTAPGQLGGRLIH